jgi:hypothetical protein
MPTETPALAAGVLLGTFPAQQTTSAQVDDMQTAAHNTRM